MSITRDNHYVPQWYQKGFFEPGRNEFAYLDLTPARTTLSDGRQVTQRALFKSPSKRAFYQTDLYSTFFGTSVNDGVERHLFGDIDSRGSEAVRAFCGDDPREWQKHFQNFFEFIDAQKWRTPKGLNWLREQYPNLTQNELMIEMQGLRTMHCNIWAEGIREIVSAEDASMKFIVSDHPVTVFNAALPPSLDHANGASQPSTVLKGTQTIFPLSRDFCLILTNQEYAQDENAEPLRQRTFARNYRSSMVRTDAFIRERRLTDIEVAAINKALKHSAKRYVAGGEAEYLAPAIAEKIGWEDVRAVLFPPKTSLFGFGGEIMAQYEDGTVRWQDAHGRTEPSPDFLEKAPIVQPQANDACGCGSGNEYRNCCQPMPEERRPSWTEVSIRERNLMLLNAIARVLELDGKRDWLDVRRELTDERIAKIYDLYAGLWPRHTDLLALLPKPDGRIRCVYTGMVHPSSLLDIAYGLPLYFGHAIIPHPFVHPRAMNSKFSPTENPGQYQQEFLKSLMLFMRLMPLVELGLITLLPDPCEFDDHLRDQMFAMAKGRHALLNIDPEKDPRTMALLEEDVRRSLLAGPEAMLQAQYSRIPDLHSVGTEEELIAAARTMRELDPLAPFKPWQANAENGGGQMTMARMAPNFEIAMYLAQATGSYIVTDSEFRWQELEFAAARSNVVRGRRAEQIALGLDGQKLGFPTSSDALFENIDTTNAEKVASVLKGALRYATTLSTKPRKPNFEASLGKRLPAALRSLHTMVLESDKYASTVRVTATCPIGGIGDNSINRLLLMANSEHHLRSLPMAFKLEPIQA